MRLSHRRRAPTLIITLALPLAASSLGSSALGAQATPALGLGTATTKLGGAPWSSALTLSPSLRLDRARLALDGGATLRGGDDGRWRGGAAADAALYSPALGALRADVVASARTGDALGVGPMRELAADARLSARWRSAGVWIGGGARRSAMADESVLPGARTARAGAWVQRGGLVISASFGTVALRSASLVDRVSIDSSVVPHSFTDSLGHVDSTFDVHVTEHHDTTRALRGYDLGDAQAALRWARGALLVDAVVGRQLQSVLGAGRAYGGVSATVALSRQLALVAGAGTAPADPLRARAATRYAQLGLRLAAPAFASHAPPVVAPPLRPATAAFAIVDGGNGRRTVRVVVPGARVVELMGDFTDWRPVALARAGADRWEVTLPIPAGQHRLNIRVDGDRWTAPPGVPTTTDEFCGEVGVVVVP